MSFLVNIFFLAISHTFAIKIEGDIRSNVVVFCFFLFLGGGGGLFFSKLGKKSPKFHWEWGLILALENTKIPEICLNK